MVAQSGTEDKQAGLFPQVRWGVKGDAALSGQRKGENR
jgi:hypothetical protein